MDSFFTNFRRVLRYFTAPVVGLAAIYFSEESSENSESVLSELVTIAHTKNGEPIISWWPLLAFTFAFGIALYHTHKTLFHFFFTYFNVWVVCKFLSENVSAKDLDTARYMREYADREFGGSKGQDLSLPSEQSRLAAYADQARLSELNSAIHMMWCSAWAILLLPAILSCKFQEIENAVTWLWVSAPFFAIALSCDIVATFFDVKAYRDHEYFRRPGEKAA